MSVVEDAKILLGTDNDKKFEVIEKRTQERLQAILGTNEIIPQELDYIVLEVVLKRFNRISNEGASSYSQEGESITFQDSDFDEFMSEIMKFKNREDENVGVVRFL